LERQDNWNKRATIRISKRLLLTPDCSDLLLETDAMVTVGMYYEVIPGREKEFEDRFSQVLDLLTRTPGHVRSYLYRRVDNPSSYAILSEWQSEEAFRAFIQSELFQKTTEWGRQEILRGRPRHEVYVPGASATDRTDCATAG
jgi:heme-degrading monooxygenase HmoA